MFSVPEHVRRVKDQPAGNSSFIICLACFFFGHGVLGKQMLRAFPKMLHSQNPDKLSERSAITDMITVATVGSQWLAEACSEQSC